jgi:hypothetical protein
MIVRQRLLIPVLFSWVLDLRVSAHWPRNVTLDDRESRIVYAPSGAWCRSNNTQNPLDYWGSHMVTEDPDAVATFKFTGGFMYSV